MDETLRDRIIASSSFFFKSTVRWRGCGRGRDGGGDEGRASPGENLGFSEGFMTDVDDDDDDSGDDEAPATNEVETEDEQVEEESNEELEDEENRKDESNEVDDDEMVEHDLSFSGKEPNDRPDVMLDVRPDVWPV